MTPLLRRFENRANVRKLEILLLTITNQSDTILGHTKSLLDGPGYFSSKLSKARTANLD